MAADSPLAAPYDPAEVEPPLAAWWEEQGVGTADPGDDGEPWSLVIPPPNVTGSLHVGHGLDMTIQDALVRHARMSGRNAVWLPGTDHAGIATQNVVERQLREEGLSRHDLGREAFVERVWRWRKESGGAILGQLRRLGCSPDWDREAFTLDEPRSAAVREVFCTLHEQGHIYRGQRIINWCPRCQTALSDIEVDHSEDPGELVELHYPASGTPDDPTTGVVVATTRVETMLGDTGVAVHPDDERYRHLVGRTVRLPLMNRDIPVVADAAVDPEFGTGAVKVTPAHDPNDWEIGGRHDLPAIDVMTPDATIAEIGGAYAGLDRFEARERIKADLDRLGLLGRVQDRPHSVGHCSRCGTVVEPRLSDQWFVAVRPLAEAAAQAVRDGRTRFVPERNTKPFLDWLDNLHDWCISRQLWWGHRIPAWYDRDGNVHVLREDPSAADVEAKGLVRDPDVLDTWFSSALWPLTTMGWPRETPELRAWYPTTVLVTGYDINTFWVSRMMLFCLHLTGEVPFRVVHNHGLVRDQHGKKMSKSFGNVIDPLELIDRYGADALRFALLRAAAPGQDVPLAEEWVEGGRRFANKLYNATRFVLGTTGLRGAEALADIDPGDLAVEDRWILSRLEATRAEVDGAFAAHDLGRAARALYSFLWTEYCDWYLELAKLRDDDVAGRVLVGVLDTALRLLHPLMPFLTEQLWRILTAAGDGVSLAWAAWPEPRPDARDDRAERDLSLLQEAVGALRRFRTEHDLAPRVRLRVLAVAGEATRPALQSASAGISRLAGVEDFRFATAGEVDPSLGDGAGSEPLGKIVLAGSELYVPLGDLVDVDAERDRLRRELDHARAEIRRAEGKLANERFVAKAPTEVVQAEREKVASWGGVTATLAAQLELLGS